MSIQNFEITDKLIKPMYNKECIFCFEDVNSVILKEETNKNVNNEGVNDECVNNKKIKLNIDTSKIILECNHNYHFKCFFTYIISKFKIHDKFIILKFKKFKCPLCQCNFEYLTLYSLLRNYVYLLKKDVKLIKQNINTKLLKLKYKKCLLFIKNFVHKNVYLQEIYNYYKNKDDIKKLLTEKQEILTMIYILNNITIL